MAEPWLLAGDFNEIKTPMEQRGGGRVNETRCSKFNDWIQDCSLIDLEANGPFYTWKGPKWDGLERVYKRLDRCLCNVLWQAQFVNAVIKVIPRVCSDHHPIVVCLEAENRCCRVRPFRYEVAWQLHENFEEIVRESWKGDAEVNLKLSCLQQNLMQWNKDTFGKIEGRKRRILNRLIAWNIIAKPDSLCSAVLIGKYGRNKDLLTECKMVRSDSEIWKNLCRLWPRVLSNTHWDIGNGRSVSFWYDRWLDNDGVLADNCLRQPLDKGKEVRVRDMANDLGEWDMEKLREWVNNDGLREGNGCADSLANLSFVQEENFVCFDSPPASILNYLYRDRMGTLYPRYILMQ
ncbi:hypothetical protein K1719_021689 [Acacia pycnantha]|nr:hypothetical protein K1719_021689 [Acacia pycnantha]